MLMMMAMTIISWEKKKGSQQRQLVAQNLRFLKKVENKQWNIIWDETNDHYGNILSKLLYELNHKILKYLVYIYIYIER